MFIMTNLDLRKFDVDLPIVIEEDEILRDPREVCMTPPGQAQCSSNKIVDTSGKVIRSEPRFFPIVHARLGVVGSVTCIILTMNATPLDKDGKADRNG